MTIIQRIASIFLLGFIIFLLLGIMASKNGSKKSTEKEARGYCFIGLLLATAIIMLIP